MSNNAWATLATNDTYSLGALVLAHSLKKVNSKYNVVVLVTSSVSYPMRDVLQSVFNEVKEVNVLDSGDSENLKLLARPELGITFTKLHCWRLTQYEKCVFLDADTLVLQNCDELFEREELSAAPDVGWPDCFNSGVFVFKPSEETYKSLLNFALSNGSFDGGDQGLLNMYFNNWATGASDKRLPFLYNLSSAAIYSYLPAFKWYGKGVKIVHFIANTKPWLQAFNASTRTVATDVNCSHLRNFLQYWWELFCANVYPKLTPEMTRLLLRRWYTLQSPLNYNSLGSNRFQIDPKYSNNNLFISKTNITSENKQHFECVDPWEDFEKTINGDASNLKNNCNASNEDRIYQCCDNINDSSNENVNSDSYALSNTGTVNLHYCETHDNCVGSPFSESIALEQHRIIELNDQHSVYNNVPQDIPEYYHSPDCSSHLPSIPINSISVVLLEESEFSQNNNGGLAASFSQLNLEEPTAEQEQLGREDQQRRQNWEQGNIDYMGRDAFDNIWNKISDTVKQSESTSVVSRAVVSSLEAEVASSIKCVDTVPSETPASGVVPSSAPVSSKVSTISTELIDQLHEIDLCVRPSAALPSARPISSELTMSCAPSIEYNKPPDTLSSFVPSSASISSEVASKQSSPGEKLVEKHTQEEK